MVKTIDTLVTDIEGLFNDGHACSPELVDELGRAVAKCVQDRLAEHAKAREPFRLRMSNLGKPAKQLWYEAHSDGFNPEKLDASAKIKFLFGDILERLLIFLTKEAGHEVTAEQRPVGLDGVSGSMDCRIDGVLVDVKSASSRSFTKFSTGSLRRDDQFGYLWQLSGYAHADEVTDSGFLCIDKTLGHICFLSIPKEEIELYDVKGRIAYLKAIISNPEPPDRCYEDLPDGKSGNRKLGVGCSYCKFKGDCWPDLQIYYYSNGPRFLTKVVREPKVDKAPQEEQKEDISDE